MMCADIRMNTQDSNCYQDELAGLHGIDACGIPRADYRHGLPAVIELMLVIGAGIRAPFRWRCRF
jgi:hypothetical protein